MFFCHVQRADHSIQVENVYTGRDFNNAYNVYYIQIQKMVNLFEMEIQRITRKRILMYYHEMQMTLGNIPFKRKIITL